MTKLKIGSKEYGFIWGTGAFIRTQDALDITLGEIMVGIENHKIMLMLTYQAMLLWCKKNDQDCEFKDFEDFIISYDEMTTDDYVKVYNSYLDASFQGSTMRKHYEDLGFIVKDEPKADVKKKTSRSRKLSSTSQAGDTTSTK